MNNEESVRNAVIRLLRCAGFAARGFASGEEFLESWHFDRPDFLPLDLSNCCTNGKSVAAAQGGWRWMLSHE